MHNEFIRQKIGKLTPKKDKQGYKIREPYKKDADVFQALSDLYWAQEPISTEPPMVLPDID